MNKAISWVTYIWLLTIETSEDVLESVKERLFRHGGSAIAIRDPETNERFRLMPPTSVR